VISGEGDSAAPSTAKCRPEVGSVMTSPPVTPSLARSWHRSGVLGHADQPV
jgi:hypothetical protein